MDSEITVTLQFGKVSFSFKTDTRGSNIKETTVAIRGLVAKNQKILVDLLQAEDSVVATPRKIQPSPLIPLSIPEEIKGKIVATIEKISNWDLLLVLLYYHASGLTNKQVRSLSEDLGKPISYDWFNTDFHRRKYEGLVKSLPIAGAKEKLYRLTERGTKTAKEIIEQLGSER